MFTKNTYDVWKEERAAGFIITLCRDFDDAIGGGFRVGLITELVGGPGVGKTQICFQLCVNAQIPKNLNGPEGAAVFIDTNRGFSFDRLKEIATATKTHCDKVCQDCNFTVDPNSFTVESILSNVHVMFCNSYIELLATIYTLRKFLDRNPKVRLIVIDSFSYLFRSLDAEINIVQTTYEALSILQTIATEFKCAVVLTNELTIRVTSEGKTQIVPALGESHSHRVNHQITIGRDDKNRRLFVANINKCFIKIEQNVPFQVTKEGLRPYSNK